MQSFTQKAIELQLILGRGDFGGTGVRRTLRNLACDVTVNKLGLPDKNSATITVYGLRLAEMEQLTKLSFRPLESQCNEITILGGDAGGALSVLYRGDVTNAGVRFSSKPDVGFEMAAITGFYAQQKKPLSDISFPGKVAYADILHHLAALAGMPFCNEGVTGSGTNVVLNGDIISKMIALANQAGLDLRLDDGIVIASLKGQPLSGAPVLLSADSGMIGYPSFTAQGITVKTLFNPNLRHGGLVRIQSIVPKASGLWMITKLTHNLSAYKKGPWESTVEAVNA